MRHLLVGFFLVLVVLATQDLYALDPSTPLSQYSHTSWTEQDGLPPGGIYAIAQDRDGYLLLGSTVGLIHFDGLRFVRSDVLRSLGLPDGRVSTLCVARDGSVWVGFGGAGGVSRLFDGRVVSYRAQNSVPRGVIAALLQDRDGTIWAGGYGLSRFQNDRWKPIETFSQEVAVYALFEDRDANVWVATSRGIWRRAANDDEFHPYDLSKVVRAFAEDRAGNIWVTGPERAFGMLAPTPARSKTIDGNLHVNGWQLLHDTAGNLWVATAGEGLWRVSAQAPRGRRIAERYSGQRGLTSEVVRSIFEDREGNLWIGTQHGLNRLRNNRFAVLPANRHEVLTRAVRVVTNGKDGSVWVGADNGLYRFLGSEWRRYGQSDGLPSVVITALHSDIRGVLWVATEQGGVARFDGKRFLPLPIPRETPLKRILAITVDASGAVWLSDADRGIFRWHEGQLVDLSPVPEIGRRLARFAHTDRAGRIWLGFYDGTLMLYEGGRFRLVTSNDGVINGNVSAVYEDRSGTIWIGTANSLSRFDGSRFVHLTDKNGLPIQNVHAIVEDSAGDLWLGVSSGLVHLARGEVDKGAASPSHWVRHSFYDMSDGLRGVPVYLGSQSVARSGEGTLWFVTSNGLAVVNPLTLGNRSMAPSVAIEEVIADGHMLDRAGIDLPPRTSRVEIGYTALTLTAPHKVRFRYRLDGFDAGWVDAGTRRRTFYTNLQPGKYIFRVTASNGGLWGASDATWAFSIEPAFYQTRWFYLTSALVVALVLWATWQLRLRHVRREFSLVVAERTRMGREIHDTLLQSLVGVALQFDELSSEIEAAPRVAKEHVERLREQVEFYVRETRHSIWNLRSPTLDRRDLASALQETAESITGSNSLRPA